MLILLMLFTLTVGCSKNDKLNNINANILNERPYDVAMKQDLLCLMMAYPDHAVNVEKSSDGKVYLVMKSGNKILYDDKKQKSFNEKLQNPDLQDMMEQVYPLDNLNKLMDENFDPGRFRVYPLLKEVYGGTKEQVQKNLVNVNIGVQFNKNNGAAEALNSVMKELIPLAQRRKDVASCVFPSSGTFNYRVISGTNQLSPHAFGIAIDLARDKRDYWKWASREQGEERIKSYPPEIPKIFEKYGFVWGGKWGHFDTLHFEYRPEIILKARYFSDRYDINKPWYGDLPVESLDSQRYIEIIDNIFD